MNWFMKKVSILKLNLQQENVLSREERKKVLGGDIGGSFPTACYVRCNTGLGSVGPYPTTSCSNSYEISAFCTNAAGGNGTYQCSCNGPF
jgi:natural product precursor